MRRRELLLGLGFLAVLVLVGAGASKLGERVGRPGAPEQAALDPSLSVEAPPVRGGLYGFEGLSDRLQLGPWGRVQRAEPARIPVEVREGVYEDMDGVRLQFGSSTVEIGRADLVRTLQLGQLAPGAEVAVRLEGGRVTIFVIR
jgi:hypothetical protein